MIRLFGIAFLFSFGLNGFVFGQEGPLSIDSLKNTLTEKTSLIQRAKILYLIGSSYSASQIDSSLFYINKAYQLANSLEADTLRIETSHMLGRIYLSNDMEKSAKFLFESLELSEALNYTEMIASNYNLIGTHHRLSGELNEAEKFYTQFLELSLQMRDSSNVAFSYNNLGIVYMMSAKYEKGLEYWKKSLDTKLLMGDKSSAANTLSNIGIYYKDIGRTDEALEYFKQGLQIELEMNLLDRAGRSYCYIGDLHQSIDNHKFAIKSYKQSLDMMDSVGLVFDKRDALIGLSRSYEKLHKYEDAYYFLVDYQTINKMYRDSTKSALTKDLAAKYESEKKEKENALLKSENEAKDAKIEEEKARTALKSANNRYLWIGLGLVFVILILIVVALNRSRKAKTEIESQKRIVDQKNEEITDSISYAKRLQTAILPTQQAIGEAFPKNFVFYKPKDMVAGDFYWMERLESKVLFAVADCTGHGVPGAFVSIVCHGALNRAVREFKLETPGEILDKTTDLVIETFEKGEEDVRDGMDIGICSFDPRTNLLEYAGANNSLYYLRKGDFFEIKPTKQPVGKHVSRGNFETHQIQLEKDDIFYLFTDGFADQFGGEKGKKFKYKNFKNLLQDIHLKPLDEQRNILEKKFVEWMGDNEQVDDVCIAGIII